MRIAYLADSSPTATAQHRSAALERLGHGVERFNPWTALVHRRPSRLDYHTGYGLLQRDYQAALKLWFAARQGFWDLVWVDSGEWFGPRTVALLRQCSEAKVVLYHIDDCTGKRDRRRFGSLRRALPQYDLCVSVRETTALEMRALGARQTLRVWMSYDEIAHASTEADPSCSLGSCIGFIGTLIPGEGRDQLLLQLLRHGIPLVIWGPRWSHSRHWRRLQPAHQGTFLSGSALRSAMAAPAACLGLLSRGNRDLHTTRSLEVPAAGGLLCAQRTSDHALLFEDGVEALLWDDSEQCQTLCSQVLADPAHAAEIRRAGHERIQRFGGGNEDICRQILAHVEAI